MKHLLIAASVLALTAGASSAQTSITFSGTAAAGVAKDAHPAASYQSSQHAGLRQLDRRARLLDLRA